MDNLSRFNAILQQHAGAIPFRRRTDPMPHSTKAMQRSLRTDGVAVRFAPC